ncbi:MAG: hypothetical protein MJA83_03350, partial [Gammaproteobacteria bacterium]|nr:hypothetical protein [Gammaproteobacteria bacterium]
ELDENEDISDAMSVLDKVITREWSKVAVHELRLLAKRRGGKVVEGDQVPELMQVFKKQLQEVQ